MSLKDSWKETGKELGGAFKGLGKNIVRSVKEGVDVADEKMDNAHDEVQNSTEKETVFNDGSWRNTGKELGGAFISLGKSLVKTAKKGVDKIDDLVDDKKENDDDVTLEVIEEKKND